MCASKTKRKKSIHKYSFNKCLLNTSHVLDTTFMLRTQEKTRHTTFCSKLWRPGAPGIIKREHNSLLPGMEQFCMLTVVVMPHVTLHVSSHARKHVKTSNIWKKATWVGSIIATFISQLWQCVTKRLVLGKLSKGAHGHSLCRSATSCDS